MRSILTPEQEHERRVEISWYEVREHLLGMDNTQQNVKRALELCAVCEHPEARWLNELLQGKTINSRDDVRDILLEQGEDPRAMCLSEVILGSRRDLNRLRRAAELGYGFAQARMARESKGQERFYWAHKSAAQKERDGLLWVGHVYSNGQGCEPDPAKTLKYYLIAAELNQVVAIDSIHRLLKKSDPQRWYWWGEAVARGLSCREFLKEFPKRIEKFNNGVGSAAVVFAIGQALKKHIHAEEQRIFNLDAPFEAMIAAVQSVSFYEMQCEAAKKAVMEWTRVGMRNQVVKDIRLVIAKLIWAYKCHADYK